LSLTGIFIVFHAFTNLETFFRFAKGVQLIKLMATFYAFQAIFFFDITYALLALMAAMFTVTWIERHNEMTALMAAGICRVRIIAPVLIAAIVINVFAAVNRELIIPRFRQELSRQPDELAANAGEDLCPQYDNRTDVLIRGKTAFVNQQRIEKPDFLLPPNLRNYGKQIIAVQAFYKAPSGDRPGGYLLDGVETPKNLGKQPSLMFDNKPLLITPRDRPDWLEPNQCFVVSDVPFEQLNGGRAFRAFASTPQLISSLRSAVFDFDAGIRVRIHSRIVQPLLDISLLFMGLPLVASRNNRNVFLAIGMCIGLATAFLLVVIGFQKLGTIELLSPALSAWIPLMIFVPVAVYMAEPMWERTIR